MLSTTLDQNFTKIRSCLRIVSMGWFDRLKDVEPTPTSETPAVQPIGSIEEQFLHEQRSEPPPLVPSTPPAGVTRGRRRGSSWSVRLAILLGLLSVFCLGGLGYAFRVYDKATTPDRTTPDVTLANYLQAYLIDKNDREAASYSCSSANANSLLTNFRSGVENKASQIGSLISVAWLENATTMHGTKLASIQVTLTESTTTNGVEQSYMTQWVFRVEYLQGWLVCGVERQS
jgi:hypothetical protein